jgi:hypothetical protein
VTGRWAQTGLPPERWLELGRPLSALVLGAVVYAGSRVVSIAPPASTALPAAIAISAGLVLAAVALGIVVRALGQAVAAQLLGQPVSAICLGGPPALAAISLGRVQLGLGLRLRATVSYSADAMPAGRRAVVDAAGPAADLLAAAGGLLMPLPHWQADILAVTIAAWGLSGLVPARTAAGGLSDGARLLQAPARRRAGAGFRRLLDQPGWSSQPGAADRLLQACALEAPAARDWVRDLAGHGDDLMRLHAQAWTLPGPADRPLQAGVRDLTWGVLARPGLAGPAADLAAGRVEWLEQHAGERRDTAAARGGLRLALAVARLRQGRLAEVEPLCAEASGAGLTPPSQATMLALVALARHALRQPGRPGRPPLDAALALDPAADLVAEAVSQLAGDQPAAAPGRHEDSPGAESVGRGR